MAQRTLGDIQKRISAVTAEITKLDLEYKKLQAEGKDTIAIQEKLSKKFDSLTKKLTTLTNVSKQYANQAKTTAKQSEQVNQKLGTAVKSYDRLSSAINKSNIAQSKSSKETSTFGGNFRKAFSPAAWGSAIASVVKFLGIYQLVYAAFEGVKAITIGSIQAFIKFEDAIGKLRAVSGAGAEETRILSESIRSAAVQTRFTATQVSQLATALAKLGATAEEIPPLILPISLAAQALGADLDKVGETIFKVSNQFGLSASESAITAQTLVAAINSSALSLETFNTAIQYVGPIAAQVGLSFSETSGYLQTLADNGFSASRIGTGLRGIFIDLKEAGVPLIDTLQSLADENISVARATDLVGKRNAAQLISILDNLDAVRKSADQNNQFAESLRASAAQMNTAAGQLDILKSAYEDLRIRIGGAITNTELFLTLLGLVNKQSEQLARGYKGLDKILSSPEGFEVFSDNLEILTSGTVNSLTVLETVLQTYTRFGKSPELLAVFQRLQAEGLSIADIQTVISERVNKDGEGFRLFVSELERAEFLTAEQAKAVRTELNYWNSDIGLLTDQFNELRGTSDIVEQQALAIQKSNVISKERNRIEEEYVDEIKKIKDLTVWSNASKEESRRVQKELNVEIEKTQEQLEKEGQKGIFANKELMIQLEGRISGYKLVRKQIADLNDASEELEKQALLAKKAQFKIDSDIIKRKEAQIKDELKRIKSIRDARVQEAESRANLERQAAQTVEQRAEAEIRLNNSIAAANEDAKEMTSGLILDINKLANDSAELTKVYSDAEFSGAIDQLSNSVNGLFGDLFGLQDALKITFTEQALDYVNDAKSVIREYGEELDKLTDKYGENAEANADYINEANLLTDVTIENLKNLLRGIDLTTAEGQLLKKIIDEQIQSLDSARPKFEEFGKLTREELFDSFVDGAKAALDALSKFNDVALENQKDRLDRELEQIENRYEIEENILKSQLDNQLITEEEYRNRSTKLKKKQIGEENAIDKAIFDAEQKRDRQNALTDYLEALASIVPELIKSGVAEPITLTAKSAITAGIATFSYAAELGAISQRKFYPKKFAEGGMVQGPSHSEGGVPFTVRGKGGYEMEGGEFIVNKRAAQLHKNVLERINDSARPPAQKGKLMFETGGIIPTNGITASLAQSTAQKGKLMFETGGVIPINGITASTLQSSAGGAEATLAQLDYLRAIAETNVNISQNTSKPVRAYVTSADLSSNMAERKIKERNTLI